MAAEAATGRRPERLNTPPVPVCFERHMAIWLDLHQRRQAGWGLAPISWVDLASYCTVMGETFTRQDLEVLKWIEDEFFASRDAAEARRAKAAERRSADGK